MTHLVLEDNRRSPAPILDAKIETELRKRKKYNPQIEVRRLARATVGKLPAPKVIVPKNLRKKPKHKKPLTAEDV